MNSNHKVNVVRIKEILPHNNADTLGIVQIEGYQVVVKKDDYKVGNLAVYVQPDSVVPTTEPFKWLWADREFVGEVPMKYRRITVRRFRKEYSEGLLLPLSDFAIYDTEEAQWYIGNACVGEGDDVAELLNITHYEEPEPGINTQNSKKLTLWQKILKFFGFSLKPYGPKGVPGYDVESLKNYPRVFEPEEEVIITEKIHGSNARFYFDGKKFWVGSHKMWRKNDLSNIWSKAAFKYPWIEEFCRAWPKFVLYGEVTPTQKGYPYGFETEVQFFAFDVRRPDGTFINKDTLFMMADVQMTVPVLYKGPYNATHAKYLSEGISMVQGAKNIREGIVITSAQERVVRGVGRAQLKLKSNIFLEKESK